MELEGSTLKSFNHATATGEIVSSRVVCRTCGSLPSDPLLATESVFHLTEREKISEVRIRAGNAINYLQSVTRAGSIGAVFITFVDSFTKILAGFEKRNFFGRDKNLVACFGVTPLFCRSLTHFETAKSPNFDFVTLGKRRDNTTGENINDLFGLLFFDVYFLSKLFSHLGFGH